MRELHFKDCFWNGDFTDTGGYDRIIQHLNNGKKTCKEIEDFMKARASIEEKYAKELLGLSKKMCGCNEMNTLKRSLDVFKLQTEHVSLSHLQLAQTMRDEAKKLEDFRERQKETRKKAEQQMDVLHKQRATQFKKTMESKKTYEQKCRDKEEAEQNMNRNASTSNAKQQEKLFARTNQAKMNAEVADRLYMQNVTALEKIREDWQKEHVKACEVFEKQEVERINTLRNMVWTHLNQLSQQCVTSDEEDIEHFVNLRRTGDKPPAPILYENFYSSQRVPVAPSATQIAPSITRRPLPNPTNTRGDLINSTALDPDRAYSVIQY
ncbi:proline-serine-threonine phosphatase-interacting protein 2 isoform X1 [Salmo salar]|uniref:Proline-serine-threonine phosphatase-interacting protein 2 isoform X1 n=1 Tax=Salmo salar TaxID=8030 RepID=A0A1S3KMW3_SALSA|nr:proline-serine-threonine phosphatase-interacting protein 2 isoform X1 [Salmo salar]|eukprot:XP_013979957.1 PREDICTED: proline-serine-threonine phosphatase-interacting protein 2 isoform X1 [Salmo salar]